MKCPDSAHLVRWVDRELEASQSSSLEAHAQQCEGCQSELQALQRVALQLRTLPARTPADPTFVAEVQQRLRGPKRTRRALPVFAVVAASVALGVGLWALRSAPEEFGVRGTLQLELKNRVGVQIFAQSPGGAARALHEGDRLQAGEGFSFSVRNHSGQELWLMLFAVDGGGAVHWFYPVYERLEQNPQSLRIARAPTQQALPEVVAPEGVASGPLRVVTLWSRAPQSVRGVEAALAAGQGQGKEQLQQLEKNESTVRLSILEVEWP